MTAPTDFLAHTYDELIHFTPTEKQRKLFARQGVAMPDGSFYIRNGSDLDNAIQAVGRATPNASESETARRNSVRRHIMKRARALNMTSKIPDTWNSDGTLKQSDIDALMDEVDEFLAHFGVKGMKWGVRRSRMQLGTHHIVRRTGAKAAPVQKGSKTPKHPVSPDAQRAFTYKQTVKVHGTSALSNAELQQLVTRMNLETQYSKLNPKQVNQGRKFVNDTLKEIGRQQAREVIVKFAPQGARWVAKHIAKKAALPLAGAALSLALRRGLR